MTLVGFPWAWAKTMVLPYVWVRLSTGTIPLRLDCWGRACPARQERKKPLPDAQMGPWSIFSPKCPNSQKASVLLMDVSLPGVPEDKVAQEGAREEALDAEDAPWDGDEPGHAGSAASSPCCKGFQQRTGPCGRRQKGHFTGSVNKLFYLCLFCSLPE